MPPHRDFDEMFTFRRAELSERGGVSDPLAKTCARYALVLFGVFLLWVPAVYYVASRFGSGLDRRSGGRSSRRSGAF